MLVIFGVLAALIFAAVNFGRNGRDARNAVMPDGPAAVGTASSAERGANNTSTQGR
jgi:hypothetical protein